MTPEEIKTKRQEYIFEMLDKYTKTEPKLSIRQVAEVFVEFAGEELVDYLKEIKKQLKKT